jgi:uncharacterized protein (DUF2164 family)
MSNITFDRTIKDQMTRDLQQYITDELAMDIGQFDAEFLLDFMLSNFGSDIYNKGLEDARSIIERKIVDVSDEIYEIEQESKYR